MTYVISKLLKDAGVNHTCMRGCAKDNSDGSFIVPHYWIALNGKLTIDYRLRMWIDHEERIPHGIFNPEKQKEISYTGSTLIIDNPFDATILESMTDGIISHVKIPHFF